jgi:hypothetical protein
MYYKYKYLIFLILFRCPDFQWKRCNNCIIKLNQLFKDFEKTIRNDIKNIINISTKKAKISFLDALIYKFNYYQKDTTKANIISKYNLSNDTLINRNTFHEKEKFIPLSKHIKTYLIKLLHYITLYLIKLLNL